MIRCELSNRIIRSKEQIPLKQTPRSRTHIKSPIARVKQISDVSMLSGIMEIKKMRIKKEKRLEMSFLCAYSSRMKCILFGKLVLCLRDGNVNKKEKKKSVTNMIK